MTKSTRIFEAVKTDDGHYECQSVTETPTQEHVERPAFYIDEQILKAMPPAWASQANELFQQGLRSNSSGQFSDYFKEVQSQFEQMQQSLQQQMNTFKE